LLNVARTLTTTIANSTKKATKPSLQVLCSIAFWLYGFNRRLTSTQKQIITEEVRPMVKELEVKAAPNPTNNSFTIYVNSNNLKDRIVMQVIDLYGRVIEIRNVAAEQTIKLGDKYKAGTYIVRLLQGDKQKELKLIKL